MHKYKLLPLLGVSLFALPALSGCSSSGGKKTVLRVLNMEDYIYEQDIKEGYTAIDLIDQFEEYIASDDELKAKYGKVQVVYDTTDTNETLYSEMQTGKALYDIICPSDYMIQKLVSANMLVNLETTEVDGVKLKEYVPNYFGDDNLCLPVIKDVFDAIPCEVLKTHEQGTLGDYAVGYMWGTLGILFNPEYGKFQNRGYDTYQVIQDMDSWSTLWDKRYKNTISVKDSMRDTYAVGVLETYKEEIYQEIDAYQAVIDDSAKTDEEKEAALATYKDNMNEIFNRCEEVNVKEVEKTLNSLKSNVFGLEVDSGKEDIITGKIGINLAWSGDAVYSMDQGEDPIKVGKDLKELCYSIPETGSNLWFDAWVIPQLKEGDRSEKQLTLALEFLNFLCDPYNVAQNMDYIGYTSFIGGGDTLDLVKSYFDYRYAEMVETDDEYQVYVVNGDNYIPLTYNDFLTGEGKHNDALNDCFLIYGEEEYDEDGETVIGITKLGDVFVKDEDDEPTDVKKTYGDLTIVDDPDVIDELGLQIVDMSFYFQDTLDNPDPSDCVFYTDMYYCPINEDGDLSECVGRQFYCQYPDQKTLNRCSVMRDYGKNNVYVMKMWERFKSNSLPIWAIILFLLEIFAAVGLIVYFSLRKRIKRNLRQKRLSEAQ